MPAIRAAALGRLASSRQRLRPRPGKMPPEPRHRLVQHVVALAECKAGIMPWRIRRVVERGDRYGGDAGSFRDVTTERHVVAVETQRGEVGGNEVAAVRRQDR